MFILFNLLFTQIAMADSLENHKVVQTTTIENDAIVDGEKEANADTVDINLLVVHASTNGSKIDPKLRKLLFNVKFNF